MGKKLPKPATETKLERAARLWMNSLAADYGDGWEGAYKDLEHGGCSSGMVSSLIYTTDCVRFYKRHQAEIDALLKEMFAQLGATDPKSLFGDKWDAEDPLAREDANQNLLAWFGFEETARNVAATNGYEG